MDDRPRDGRGRRPGGCRGLGMGLAVTEELAVRTMTIAEPEPVPILYLESTTTFGGAINSLVHLLHGLDSGRYRPILATGQPDAPLRARLGAVPIYRIPLKPYWVRGPLHRRVHALPIFRNRFVAKASIAVRFGYWSLVHTLPEALRYWRIGRRHGVRAVHLNNGFTSQPAGILAAKLLGVPCIAHTRGFVQVSPLARYYARLVDHHIAISTAIRDNLLEVGIEPDRISVVLDGVELSEFRDAETSEVLKVELGIPAEARVFGIFGRIIRWKGIREFVLAAEKVLEAEPTAYAVIVGGVSDGSQAYHEEVVRLIETRGLAGRVIMTGYRTDIGSLMKAMDVVVHASIEPEPFGMVLIEAMAAGRPVVATRAGGPLDIIVAGQTGELVEPGDVDGMADAVLGLLRDPARARRMGREGARRAESLFGMDRYAAEVEAVYARTIRCARPGAGAASPRPPGRGGARRGA